MIRAIETSYKGYRFRSRLEARWATAFDHVGLKWAYEPEGFDLGADGFYLPDFFLDGNGSYGPYVEIKGQKPTAIEIEKLASLCEAKIAYGTFFYGPIHKPMWIDIHKDGFVYRESDMFSEISECQVFADGIAHGSIRKAIQKAASARFEHGERP